MAMPAEKNVFTTHCFAFCETCGFTTKHNIIVTMLNDDVRINYCCAEFKPKPETERIEYPGFRVSVVISNSAREYWLMQNK